MQMLKNASLDYNEHQKEVKEQKIHSLEKKVRDYKAIEKKLQAYQWASFQEQLIKVRKFQVDPKLGKLASFYRHFMLAYRLKSALVGVTFKKRKKRQSVFIQDYFSHCCVK
jgi:hypothetical protein